ncbi:RTA1 like protein-domain-containing protein [Rhexocercosporidium sp. MPI-PUGE-AT-0058]|nr:RTA1 like protein-domain-containing protein [Rhexocercosporidium sp. MPI-PUGE-AT-0058]
MPGSNSNPDSIWLFNPSLALAIVFAVIYAVPLVWQSYLTVFRYRAYYFSVVIVGAAFEVGGYVSRAVSIKRQDSIPPYAVSSSLIVLAPLFIAAGNYLLLTRLCTRVLPVNVTRIYHLPLKNLTKIFVTSDIFTFLVQVSGSGIASSNNWEGDLVKIGENVLIAGLAVQVFSLVVFLAVLSKFQHLARREQKECAGAGWKVVVRAVWISCSLILVRSVYRLIEFALGIFGYPFTHEWMFYVFESVPMVPAIVVFCIWHPAAYFGRGRRAAKEDARDDVPLEVGEGGQVRAEEV